MEVMNISIFVAVLLGSHFTSEVKVGNLIADNSTPFTYKLHSSLSSLSSSLSSPLPVFTSSSSSSFSHYFLTHFSSVYFSSNVLISSQSSGSGEKNWSGIMPLPQRFMVEVTGVRYVKPGSKRTRGLPRRVIFVEAYSEGDTMLTRFIFIHPPQLRGIAFFQSRDILTLEVKNSSFFFPRKGRKRGIKKKAKRKLPLAISPADFIVVPPPPPKGEGKISLPDGRTWEFKQKENTALPWKVEIQKGDNKKVTITIEYEKVSKNGRIYWFPYFIELIGLKLLSPSSEETIIKEFYKVRKIPGEVHKFNQSNFFRIPPDIKNIKY